MTKLNKIPGRIILVYDGEAVDRLVHAGYTSGQSIPFRFVQPRLVHRFMRAATECRTKHRDCDCHWQMFFFSYYWSVYEPIYLFLIVKNVVIHNRILFSYDLDRNYFHPNICPVSKNPNSLCG